MYDGYSTIKNKYFPKAIFVFDLFHVVKLLTTAVNKIRIRTYNQIAIDDTIERHFLKTNRKFIFKDQLKIYKNEYHSIKFNTYISYGEIIFRYLKISPIFWDGYSILQELIDYNKYETFTNTDRIMNRIIAKLNTSGEELLMKVADSFKK